jgi:FkbM family methyltransferase
MSLKLFSYVFTSNGESFTVEFVDTPDARHTAREILEGRSYPIFPFVPSADVIFDVGANIGATSVRLALAYPAAQIYSFEPAPATFHLLQKNTMRLTNVTPLNFGLYSETKEAQLFHSLVDSGTASIGRSYINADSFDTVKLCNPTEWMQKQDITRIDILKVDTEGCEVPILHSLKKYIPEIKLVYLEYHSERDRLAIDELLAPTHILCSSRSQCGHLGELAYARKDLEPAHGELHKREIIMPSW